MYSLTHPILKKYDHLPLNNRYVAEKLNKLTPSGIALLYSPIITYEDDKKTSIIKLLKHDEVIIDLIISTTKATSLITDDIIMITNYGKMFRIIRVSDYDKPININTTGFNHNLKFTSIEIFTILETIQKGIKLRVNIPKIICTLEQRIDSFRKLRTCSSEELIAIQSILSLSNLS